MEERQIPVRFSEMENLSEISAETLEKIDEGLTQGNARILSLDAGGDHLIVMVASYADRALEHFLALEVDMDNRLFWGKDYRPILWSDESVREAVLPEVVFDGEKNLYVIDSAKRAVYVIDGDGEETFRYEWDPGSSVYCAGKALDGRPIFYRVQRSGECEFFSFEDGSRAVLAEAEGLNLQKSFPNLFGGLYYMTVNRLLRWDVREGRCEEIYALDGLGSEDCLQVIANSEKELLLFFDNRKECFCLKLARQPKGRQEEIRVLMRGTCEYVSVCAEEYNRKHPGVRITVTKMETGNPTAFNRLAEEMKAGEGPDLLIVRRDQMEILESAGCLLPIDGLVSEELEEQLFGGVLRYGEIDGTQYGMPFEASLGTMIVSWDHYTEDRWSLQEAISAFLTVNRQEPQYESFEFVGYTVTADQLLYNLLLENVDNSDFLDLESGKCNFASEEFEALLRFCGQYCDKPGKLEDFMDLSEQLERFLSEPSFVYVFGGGLLQYSQTRKVLGESFHPVGYPTSGSGGNMLRCYECAAVNRWTEHSDTVEDFVRFLLSEKSQANHTMRWIRKDVFQKRVREHTDLQDGPILLLDGYGVIALPGREDGSSYVDEYVALMDGGTMPSILAEVQNIIGEEAMAYFYGDKLEKEAARVIQNRVQLYLDEQG